MASWLHEKLERGSSIRLDTSSTGSWSSGRTSGICTPKSSTPVPDESFQNHLLEHSLMKIRDNADSAKNDSMAIPEGRKRYFKLIPITAFLLMTLTFQISKVQLQMMRQLKMPLAWHEQFFTTAACIWQVSFACRLSDPLMSYLILWQFCPFCSSATPASPVGGLGSFSWETQFPRSISQFVAATKILMLFLIQFGQHLIKTTRGTVTA